jgi:hypothetical protein
MTPKWKYPAIIGAFLGVLLVCYLLISPGSGYHPKVYDCFLFYNELELLEIRLNEMNDFVDKFVIVEAGETFRGNPKPYYFEENRDRFEKFSDKIIHVKVDQHLATDNPWIRERYQRQQVLKGLKNCRKNDLVILSDVDEIVSRKRLPRIIELITSGQAQAVVCEQKMYQGFLNRYQDKWHGSVCTPYHVIKRISTKATRRLRNMRPRLMRRTGVTKITCLPDAGWHFTSMGGIDRHILKLESYSHHEFDRPELKQAEKILQVFRSHQWVKVDDSFPKHIVENRSHYEDLGFIDKEEIAS